MICFGIYNRKCNEKGEIRVPAKWIEKDTELIGLWCKDCLQQTEFFRFFYEKDDLESFMESVEREKDYEILQSSTYKILKKRKVIVLPQNFLKKSTTKQKTEIVCLGIGHGFEIWFTDEYEKMQENLEEMFNILDSIEF